MPELTRRRFMRESAAVAVGAMTIAVPGVHVRAEAPAPVGSGSSPPLRWGVIGTGTRGNATHIPAVSESPESELLALCDIAEDRLHAAAKRAGKAVATYADYQKLLANPDVNAVVIATPNLVHREMLLAALQAGKHVLCEKPAGISLADATEMQRAADAAKTVVMFGMQYRHNAQRRKIRELIDVGKIGKPKYIVQNCARGDWNLGPDVWQYADPKLFDGQPRNWRFSHAATGGTLNEFSCHYLDLLHWYAGGTPTAVSADGGIAMYKDGRDTWDHASLTLIYPNDVKAVHTLNLFGGRQRADMSVIGDEGSIELVGDTFQLVSAPRRKGTGRSTGSTEEDIEVDATTRKTRGAGEPNVLALYADFLQCVKTGKRPDADAARAVAASKTCFLAELSAQRRAEVKWNDASAA